jgi:hypothetical protein
MVIFFLLGLGGDDFGDALEILREEGTLLSIYFLLFILEVAERGCTYTILIYFHIYLYPEQISTNLCSAPLVPPCPVPP